jgi:hypothetical protein
MGWCKALLLHKLRIAKVYSPVATPEKARNSLSVPLMQLGPPAQ